MADYLDNLGRALRLLLVYISHPDHQSTAREPARRHPGHPPLPDARHAEQHLGSIRYSSVLPTSLCRRCQCALLCQPRRRPRRRVSVHARQRVDTGARP